MLIDIYSRSQILKVDPQSDVAVISISAPADPAPLKGGWGPLLRLEFHDVVNLQFLDALEPPLIIFNEELAAQIDAFAWEHKDKNFAVHCTAGMSRSVAVGLFLKEIFEGDLRLHATHTTAAANSLVHRTLMRKYWEVRLS